MVLLCGMGPCLLLCTVCRVTPPPFMEVLASPAAVISCAGKQTKLWHVLLCRIAQLCQAWQAQATRPRPQHILLQRWLP
jgi:hypothetical protein